MAPCPPIVRLDEGAEYHASKEQLWLLDKWHQFWGEVRDQRKKVKGDLYIVSNGDATEGAHHQTTQILSGNLEAQTYALYQLFDVPMALKPDKVFIVRGTEAHVGQSAQSEESLGRHYGSERSPTGTWSWWELPMELHGIRLDFRHHGRVGGRPWTRGSGIGALAFQIWVNHVENDLPYPHLAIRSHRHTHQDSGDLYKTRAIVTPAWQLMTAHGHKVVAEELADLGGLIVTVFPEGRYEVKVVRFRPDPTPAWKP